MPLVLLDQPRGTYWKTWQRYVEDHLLRRRMIAPEDLASTWSPTTSDAAVDEITGFYRVYHSSRYVDDQLVIRTTEPLPDALLADLTREFAPIIQSGTVEACRPFAVERDEPAIMHLPRIAFRFDRRGYGLLRRLIDRINKR